MYQGVSRYCGFRYRVIKTLYRGILPDIGPDICNIGFRKFESVFLRAPPPDVCTRLALSGNHSLKGPFLEFHAYDEVPVQSRPINLGLQLADLI